MDWRGDVAVVGGGIVGLAAAREILRRAPSTRLVVLEKEQRLGQHQTGHNSGVVHSGIYYAPGSLKARACVAGARALTRYCEEKGIRFERRGKVIVATEQEELPRLERLHQRGTANGVPGLEMIGPERLREIEPHCAGIRALWSPGTAVVDFGEVAAAYAEDVAALEGEIWTGHQVRGIRRVGDESVLETDTAEVRASRVVVCAGLHADRLARLSGASPEPRIVPFRGDYFALRPERRYLVKGLIYPVPDPAFPFLGIHLTRTISDEVLAGPNAVLAFAREGYRLTAVNPYDLWEALSYAGFRRLVGRHWRVGLAEFARDVIPWLYLQAARRYVPELRMDDLEPSRAGVRAQALDEHGRLLEDFVVDRAPGVLHVRNAPSPAATSSLAIGVMIADALEETVA